MGYGLFGKLPQKRDFVSVGLPHQVLHPFETWLQSAVAASRNEIGRDWQNYYMVAPIWNFWLGPQVLGTTCAGALMPSVDQVGRYFPLAIIYVAEQGEDLPPPLLDPMSGWYREIDQRLLAVLATEGQFEVTSVLSGLPSPQIAAFSPLQLSAIAPYGVPSASSVAAPPPAQPAPVAAPDQGAAASGPEGTPPTGNPWDLPSMSDDAVASIRMVTGAQVEPPGRTTSELWDAGAASAAAVDGVSSAKDADPAPVPAEEVENPADEEHGPPLDDRASQLTAAAPDQMAEASGAEAPAPDESAPAMPAAVEESQPEPAVPEPPAAPVMAEWVPPRIHVTEFKGGVLTYVEPGRSIAEAAGALIEADYRNASLARSFWWCETTPNGSAQLHTRQGLPDPYFFSRMLMWQPQ
jgi:type VI secretion system protein ImpM